MEHPEPKPRATATLVLVATFALGMIAGAAILHLARPGPPGPPGPPPPPPVSHLQRELGLDPSQVEQLREILGETRERVRAEADATRERIREILTPEQRERFDAMGPPPQPPFPPGPGAGPGPGPRPGPPPRAPRPPRR